MINIGLIVAFLAANPILTQDEIDFIDNINKEMLYIEQSSVIETKEISKSYSELGQTQ